MDPVKMAIQLSEPGKVHRTQRSALLFYCSTAMKCSMCLGLQHGVDDIQFTLDMISDLQDNLCVDSKRIYAAGKSNGGGLVRQCFS